MNNKIKITPKAGMKLKTRDGRDAMIYHIHDQQVYPIHGAILFDNRHWNPECWTINGETFSMGDPNRSDLILEGELDFDWSILPAWGDKYIAMDKCGIWHSFGPNSPIIKGDQWGLSSEPGIDYFSLIPICYAPKNFTGSWKESLFMNPKYQDNEQQKPIDRFNHLMDAIRYVVYSRYWQRD